jgi:hypothetical protein
MNLDRHTLDAVARAVVSGERGLGEEEDKLADDVALLMPTKLKALDAPGLNRVAQRTPLHLHEFRERYGDALLRLMLARVDKHLAMLALNEETIDA